MVETDLGTATIMYEDPNEGIVEETVANEHIAYFQDHWILKTGEHEAGHDVVLRVPVQRVYFVERNVEAFEQEIGTRLHDVQSVADNIGSEVQTLRGRIESITEDLLAEVLGGPERTEDADRDDSVIHINIDDPDDSTDTDTDTDSDTDSGSESDADSDHRS